MVWIIFLRAFSSLKFLLAFTLSCCPLYPLFKHFLVWCTYACCSNTARYFVNELNIFDKKEKPNGFLPKMEKWKNIFTRFARIDSFTVNNNVCSYWKIVTEGSKYEVNVILFKVHTHCYGRMHTQRQIYCKIKYIEQSTESIWCGIETSMCQSHAYIHKQSVIRFTMLFYPIWRCLQITFFIVCAQCRADARWYPIYTYIFVSPKT